MRASLHERGRHSTGTRRAVVNVTQTRVASRAEFEIRASAALPGKAADFGSEFTAKRVREGLERVGVKTLSIEPGSPSENGYVGSFNGKRRDELLAREVFDTLLEAKVLIGRWRKAYNTIRPHSSLGYRPPAPESRRPCPLGSATPRQAERGDPLAGLPW